MLYNQLMLLQNTQFPQALLVISTKTLDFGVLTRDDPSEGHGQATLIIANEGEKILVGRISLQVAWVSVYPPDFRINPGESSEHVFTIRNNAETSWTTHKLGSDFIALINSNGGSETIGGFYYSDPSGEKKKKKNPIRPWLLVFLPFAIGAVAGMVYWLSSAAKASQQNEQQTAVAAIYTQAAETYEANLLSTLPSPTVIEPTAVMDIPGIPTAETASAPQATFTPWPADNFPSPDAFIHSYYEKLQNQAYEEAWWMLSEKMQIACCYQGGGIPFDVYQANWEAVDYVEVVYAYLQAYDTNPAEVTVNLIYHNRDGTTEETFNTVFIISDAVRNTLLIDEVK